MFPSTEVGEVSLSLKEKECDFEWKIEKSRLFPPAPRFFDDHDYPSKAGFPPSYFRPASKAVKEYHLSRRFSFEGETWNVGICTCPEKTDIYLCLYRRISAIPPIDLEVSVAFKTVSGKEIVRKEETYYFKGDSYHGMEGSVCKNDILARESEFVASGFLTVVCTLKKLEDTSSTAVGDTSTFSMPTPNAGHFIGAASQPTGSGAFRIAASTSTDDSSLCEDLKEMLLNGLSHDLILKVGDKELRAHQDILRTRSQVFKSMLSHDTKESGVIDIPDCDPGAMEQFLCYIYTGKVDSLDPSNMLKLYYIADKYDMKGLKRNCCVFIKKSLSVTNICEVIQLALNHSDSSLLEHATEYFMDNAIDIIRTVEWQSFMKDNSATANELMIKSFEKLKNKNT